MLLNLLLFSFSLFLFLSLTFLWKRIASFDSTLWLNLKWWVNAYMICACHVCNKNMSLLNVYHVVKFYIECAMYRTCQWKVCMLWYGIINNINEHFSLVISTACTIYLNNLDSLVFRFVNIWSFWLSAQHTVRSPPFRNLEHLWRRYVPGACRLLALVPSVCPIP